MGHIPEHCATPTVSRHWKRLGHGALWACDCGKTFRLTTAGSPYGTFWTWKALDR